MSDTFCWCVSRAWAYLSCVFYVVSDVCCPHRACPNVFSVQIVANSPVTELLSRINYVLRENWQKKWPIPFTRKIFDTSLLNISTFHLSWYVPSCIGDAFSILGHISWIRPEWCSCCVPISPHLAHPVGWHVRNGSMDWTVPNGHSSNREYHLWIHALRIKKNDVNTDVFFLIL